MRQLRTKISPALAELAGETTIWPIWIATPRHSGYTYYGGSFADGSDRFLATGDGIMLFPDVSALLHADGISVADSFLEHDGFHRLIDALAERMPGDDTAEGEWMAGFDFNAALSAIRGGVAHRAPHAGGTLDCLNALRDAASQFSGSYASAIPGPALETLYEALWKVVPASSVDYRACEIDFARSVSILDDILKVS